MKLSIMKFLYARRLSQSFLQQSGQIVGFSSLTILGFWMGFLQNLHMISMRILYKMSVVLSSILLSLLLVTSSLAGIDLNGDGDHVSLGDITILDGAGLWTIAIHIKFDTLNTTKRLVAKWDAGTPSFVFSIDDSNSDELIAAHQSAGGISAAITSDANLSNSAQC